jgi:hypothetical protein
MKQVLVRLLFVLVATLIICAVPSTTRAQQADEDPSPSRTLPQQQPHDKTHPPSQNAKPETSNADPQTQDALAFTGIISKQQDEVVLKDPVTKMIYRFDDPSRAEAYVGKQVKVIGKLGLNSNTIHVNSIQAIPHDEHRLPEERMHPSFGTR